MPRLQREEGGIRQHSLQAEALLNRTIEVALQVQRGVGENTNQYSRILSLLEDMMDTGCMDERHFETSTRACDDAMICLSAHNHSEQSPPLPVLLRDVGT